MKKHLNTLLIVTILMMSSFVVNAEITPSEKVQSEFNRQFALSTEVKWEAVSDFYKVTFTQRGQYLTAFFNQGGGIERVARNINPSALPLILQKDFENKLALSWITECFEVSGVNGAEYYLTLENANDITTYHSNSNDWDVYKKTIKS